MINIDNYVSQYKKLINQIPGLMNIQDLKSRFALANNRAAKLMGFKSIDDIVGTYYAEMKCDASEEAEIFESQDRLVFSGVVE